MWMIVYSQSYISNDLLPSVQHIYNQTISINSLEDVLNDGGISSNPKLSSRFTVKSLSKNVEILPKYKSLSKNVEITPTYASKVARKYVPSNGRDISSYRYHEPRIASLEATPSPDLASRNSVPDLASRNSLPDLTSRNSAENSPENPSRISTENALSGTNPSRNSAKNTPRNPPKNLASRNYAENALSGTNHEERDAVFHANVPIIENKVNIYRRKYSENSASDTEINKNISNAIEKLTSPTDERRPSWTCSAEVSYSISKL